MREADLFLALRDRYPKDAWALFAKVADATGARQVRTADAIAMSLWPSRGLEIHGFEIKVSRGDWLRELKAPAKAESIARWCDRWWLVVADAGMVRLDELPPTWGLLALRTSKLHQVKGAPKLDPPPPSRDFLAAMLRAAQKVDPERAAIDAARTAGYDAGVKDEKAIASRELRRVRDELEAERVKLRRFEEASGIHVTAWEAGRLGDAVRLVLEGGADAHVGKLRQLQEAAHRIAAGIDRQLDQVARATEKLPCA